MKKISLLNLITLPSFFIFASFLFVLIPLIQVQAESSPWPMFQHDAQHTGQSSFVGPGSSENPELYILIEGEKDNDYFGAPVIDSENTLYLIAAITKQGQTKTGIYVFTYNGAQKWFYEGSLNVSTVPALSESNKTLYALSGEGVLAINTENGDLKWKEDLFPLLSVQNPIIGNNGAIYFTSECSLTDGSGDLFLITIDNNGQPIWIYDRERDDTYFDYNLLDRCWITSSGSPTFGHDGTIYFGYEDTLYAVDSNGTKKWQRTFVPDCDYYDCKPRVDIPSIDNNGTVYVIVHDETDWRTGTDQGRSTCLHAINPDNPNDERWGRKCFSRGASAPITIAFNNNFYVVSNYYWNGRRAVIYGFDSQGNQLFQWSNSGVYAGQLLLDRSETIYGVFGNTVKAFEKGYEEWAIYTWSDRNRVLSLDSRGTLYMGGQKKLYALSPKFTPKYEETLLGSAANAISGISEEPINLALGNYIFQRTDFSVPGRGLPFIFQRTYNSLDDYNGPLGYGWTHNYNVFLLENYDGTVKIKYGDGHAGYFEPIGSGNYNSKYGGNYDILEKDIEGNFILTKKNQAKYFFDIFGKLFLIRDKNNNKITLQYDDSNNLINITDTAGRVFSFEYQDNKISTITDLTGRTAEFFYDEDDNLISSTDAEGNITGFTYDLEHRVDIITDARGNIIIDNDYNEEGKTISQTNGRGFVWTFEYDNPNPGTTIETNPKGNTTVYVHDDMHRLIEEIDAQGNSIKYAYDDNNNRTSITDKNSNTYNFTYDNRGNLLTSTDPLGNIIVSEYDSYNNLIRSTDALGNSAIYNYDSNHNLISIIDALSNETNFSYDSFGQLVAITDANGNSISNSYDEQGNLIMTTDALSNSVLYTFDEIGRKTSIIDPKGNSKAFLYDNNDNLITVVDALGNNTYYRYDSNNNRTQVRDANGNESNYTYNENNLISSIQDSEGNTTSFEYDEIDNRISATDPNNNTINYSYDDINNLVSINYPDGTSVSFEYDANGNGIEMIDKYGITSYQYDALNRLTQITDSNNKTVQYIYNANGKITALTYPDLKSVQYTYDNLNRLIKVRDWLANETIYNYDPVGNLVSVNYPNGTKASYAYDEVYRLTELANKKQDESSIVSYSYTYDANGNIIKTISDKPIEIPLDLKIINYVYQNNKLIQAGDTTFSYDNNGNLIKKETPDGDVNYVYNFQDDLIKVENNINGDVVEYKYDGEQNRIASIYNGNVKNYVLDRNSELGWVLAETDESGNIDKYYIYGLGLISQVSSDGQALYYHYNSIGSTIALTDSGGEIANQYSYTDFGEIISQVGTTENPFQYVGRYGVMTEPNDLMYMRMRYYDSETGRFIIPDPLENLSYYVYTGNNPIVFIDPFGLWRVGLLGLTIGKYIVGGFEFGLSSEGIYLQGKGGSGLQLEIETPITPSYSPSTPEAGLETEVSWNVLYGRSAKFKIQNWEVMPIETWEVAFSVGVFGGEIYTHYILRWQDVRDLWERFLKKDKK